MKLVAVGDNCMDVYESLNQAFPGGNPLNVSVYAVRLGLPASYIGAVGTDENGAIMHKALESKGVDTSHLKILEGKTAVTQVELVSGDRIFGDYDEGVLRNFKLSDEDVEFISKHDLMVTGLWGMIENDLHRIKAKRVPIAFDFATKLDHPTVNIAMPFTDYAFFSYDEGDNEFIRSYIIEKFAMGPKVIIVTMGEKGSMAYDGIKFYHYGIVPCQVVDTMGAGDSYIAGFLKGILEKREISECMAMGAQSSSVTLGYLGAWTI